ncbi:MAG: Na+/H+ antiporter NhaA [Myxococcota bacterium]
MSTEDPSPPPPKPSHPPGSWAPARRAVVRALAPVERFLAIEASSGVALLFTAAIALTWANSPWAWAYQALWHTKLGVSLGGVTFEKDLHFWVNDGLMTVFFFVVGLEIRREASRGELSTPRRAALPLAAAFGGMLVPALVYVAFNAGGQALRGWGVPMATDIAFAVGIFALLGPRISPALRILLLALAVVDDVGAIVVIALFYSAGLEPGGFFAMGVGMVVIFAMRLFGVRRPWLYVPAGAVVWAGALAAGVHPTLAGVVVGLMTPSKAWYSQRRFLDEVDAHLVALRGPEVEDERDLFPHLDALNVARTEAVSPVERLQHVLHTWVAFGVMPLFALANAGVPLGDASFDGDGLRVFLGVTVGLAVGKPVGVYVLARAATRLGIALVPRGLSRRHLGVVGLAAGIGFTMALFVATLAFEPGPLLETAKLGVLAGSGAAGLLTLLVGWRALTPGIVPGAATTAAEAEASTSA